ncbi:MAG: toxin-antitoxin system HicB family antitoxin [Syntrophorhabdales bacterium]|jgi:predicted HicB family RNase H-like nuclease
MMTYKGYSAKVEFDDEAMIFHGEVIGIRDVVTFQGKTVNELIKAFHDSVDDYLDMCKSRGEEPKKPFSGKFVVRVSPEVHRQIYVAAKKTGQSINAWLNETLSVNSKVPLMGSGTFSVVERKVRMGRSPHSGKEIKVAAMRVPKFSAGAALKAAADKAAPAKQKAQKAPAKPKKK